TAGETPGLSLHRQLSVTHVPGVKLLIQPLDCLDLFGITWDEGAMPTLRLIELIHPFDGKLVTLVVRDFLVATVGDTTTRELPFFHLTDATTQPLLTDEAGKGMMTFGKHRVHESPRHGGPVYQPLDDRSEFDTGFPQRLLVFSPLQSVQSPEPAKIKAE